MLAQLLVEGAERLVHQHQGGLEHERAGERDPLLLPAGQLGGTASLVAFETDHGKGTGHPVLALLAGNTADAERVGTLSPTERCGNSA